jgi:muramoyltetrapeptide carboxypeptidase LdcA involved in peptidoglycan recycling
MASKALSLRPVIKPSRLRPGDSVAAVTLSWGGRGTYPHRYEAGKRQFEQTFGCRVVETRHALREAAWIAANPKARADDLMHPYLVNSLRRTLFSDEPIGEVRPNTEGWTVERLDWGEPANQARRRTLVPSTGWRWLQGTGRVTGRLIGGCIDVMEWLKGTIVWPAPDAWADAVLFIETSEEAPSPQHVERWLRSYGAQGILERIAAILVGRPGGHALSIADHARYDDAVLA